MKNTAITKIVGCIMGVATAKTTKDVLDTFVYRSSLTTDIGELAIGMLLGSKVYDLTARLTDSAMDILGIEIGE